MEMWEGAVLNYGEEMMICSKIIEKYPFVLIKIMKFMERNIIITL